VDTLELQQKTTPFLGVFLTVFLLKYYVKSKKTMWDKKTEQFSLKTL